MPKYASYNCTIFPLLNITFSGKNYSTFLGLIFKGSAQVDAKPTLAFKHLLAKKIDPDLTINQVPLTPILIKEKINQLDLESAFKEVSQVSGNLKKRNKFNLPKTDVNYDRLTDDMTKRYIQRLKLQYTNPMCLPEINDEKNLGVFKRTASNLKNDADLENAFTKFMTLIDIPEDQVPLKISFYGKTALGKHVLDNFSLQIFSDLVKYFHDR
jgi:hypothetical protein